MHLNDYVAPGQFPESAEQYKVLLGSLVSIRVSHILLTINHCCRFIGPLYSFCKSEFPYHFISVDPLKTKTDK